MRPIKFFPTPRPEPAVVITGIYVQPKRTKEIALDLLKTICGLLHDVATQNQVSRKIMGDFNVDLIKTGTHGPTSDYLGGFMEKGFYPLISD